MPGRTKSEGEPVLHTLSLPDSWLCLCSDIVPEQIRPGAYQAFFQNKKGIEIGGPSALFKENAGTTVLPVYGWLAGLDNAIFDGNTLWAKELKDGGEFVYQEVSYAAACQLPAISA